MKNITKNVLMTLTALTAAITIAGAQSSSTGATVSASVQASSSATATMPIMKEGVKDMRDQMHASNTEERKEMNARASAMAQNRIVLMVQRLEAREKHLQSDLARLVAYVKSNSSTTPASVTKAVASGAAAESAVASVQVYASSTVTVNNKDTIKSAIKKAQDAIKTFQDDVKAALKNQKIDRSMWDLKANKKI